MPLLYEGRESSAVHGVRFSPDGGCLAAVTRTGQVRWFEVADQITPRGGCDTPIVIEDVAFSGSGEQLAVIGCGRKVNTGYPESALTVLIVAPFAETPTARHRIAGEVDGRMVAEIFAAPIFLPRPLRRYPLLVGTVDGVLGIDPETGATRFRLATSNDFGFVTRRGLVYLAATETLVVAFDMHPGLWLIAHRRDRRGNFRESHQLDSWGRAHHAGAALSPSGRLLAVSVQDDFNGVARSFDARGLGAAFLAWFATATILGIGFIGGLMVLLTLGQNPMFNRMNGLFGDQLVPLAGCFGMFVAWVGMLLWLISLLNRLRGRIGETS